MTEKCSRTVTQTHIDQIPRKYTRKRRRVRARFDRNVSTYLNGKAVHNSEREMSMVTRSCPQ